MKTVRLGRSGLEISAVILGMMSYGDPTRGNHSWTVGIDEARPILRRALDAGITTFDTANVYSEGTSEEITGTLLQEFAPRDDLQILTKWLWSLLTKENGSAPARASPRKPARSACGSARPSRVRAAR
ncbi:MAG: alcohol dehydrogenase [Frondihabitans sp.]|nr:alcohol dehydrogenase [Frondihabitans sp.]